MGIEQDHREGLPHWVVETKLTAPQIRVRVADRPHLLSQLNWALSKKAAIVTAPAGFGKSTLIAQWRNALCARGERCGWLSVTDSDNDPREFLCYLAMSLVRLGIGLGKVGVAIDNRLAETSLALAEQNICAGLAQAPAPEKVLFIDDCHRLTGQSAALLMSLIKSASDNVHFVMGARSRANLSVEAMLASGEMTEITGADLLLTESDIAAIAENEKERASSEEVFRLTEGWPIAVQLYKLASKDHAPCSYSLDVEFHADMARYLASQIFDKLPADCRSFVLQTILFDMFCPDLANAAGERNDADKILTQLAPIKAFLIQLDSRGVWYRYHHLFSDCLKELHSGTLGPAIERIHSNAARWFAEDGSLEDAVKHAAAGKNYELCVKLIESRGGFEIGILEGANALERLLRFIPEDEMLAYPRILFASSYLALKQGDYAAAERRFDIGAADPSAQQDSDCVRDRECVKRLVDAYLDRLDVGREVDEIGALVLDRILVRPALRGTLLCADALVAIANGRLRQGEKLANEAMGSMRQAGTIVGLNYAYLHAATAAYYQGQFDVAIAYARKANTLAEENFGVDNRLKHFSRIIFASVQYWRGDLMPHDFEELVASLKFISNTDSWVEIAILALDPICHYAAAHGQHAVLDTIRRIIESIAEGRDLPRLAKFGTLIDAEIGLASGLKRRHFVIADELQRTLPEAAAAPQASDWSYLLTAAARIQPAEGMSPETVEDILSNAARLAERLGANLHLIRIHVAQAGFFESRNEAERGAECLSVALIRAAHGAIRQPFVNASIDRSIYLATKSLKQSGEGALALNLVNEIEQIERRFCAKSASKSLLTRRERQVLEEISLGFSVREVAENLDLTENTVKYHTKNIYMKLAVTNRTQALSAARKAGLLGREP